jgi:hypothetical protein
LRPTDGVPDRLVEVSRAADRLCTDHGLARPPDDPADLRKAELVRQWHREQAAGIGIAPRSPPNQPAHHHAVKLLPTGTPIDERTLGEHPTDDPGHG